jgi:hypothetical protein
MVALFPAACYLVRIRPAGPSFLPGFLVVWFLLSLPWAIFLYLFGVPGACDRLLGRLPDVPKSWKRLIGSAVAIWAYLALGVLVGIYYGAVVVSVRGYDLYDVAFARIDSVVLFGHSVIGISHGATALVPAAECIYLAMFGIMGAGVILLCLSDQCPMAFEMSSSIIVAYILSAICFALWPSAGPFSLCSDHLSHFPHHSVSLPIQQRALSSAARLWQHKGVVTVPLAYFFSFPAMHLAQPLIVAWFVRRWKRASALIVIYCTLLIPAILVLEWHYFADIIGGIVVAVLSVVLVEGYPGFVLSRKLQEGRPLVAGTFLVSETNVRGPLT